MITKTQGEEDVELLASSHSGHGKPGFRVRAPQQRPAISILLSGPILTMVGLIVGAALISGVHHFTLIFFKGRCVEGRFSQFWMKNISNVLSIVVQTLCVASISVSLTQLIWWFLRRQPFTVAQLDQLFSLPGCLPTLRLVLSKSSWRILPIIFISTLIPVYTFVSILAPNALEVGPASPKTQTLTVPTIFYGRDPLEQGWAYPRNPANCFYQLTSNFERVLGSSMRFDSLLGWSAPLGCESGCNYTMEYSAPALRCSIMDTKGILYDNASSPSQPLARLWISENQAGVYNATTEVVNSNADIAVS
ncbi:hypothetical protein ARMGADRAFT_94766 [Armillaria gallica]|uniref:Uncharacterized protein n=1 Tax=Armillaria gallica TaxID=47427 RepID=A0A2H3CF59_ARMGA|nr:hypothetical protein ARMGADRAFT_94766 [Armillaria gallica]